MEKEDSNINTNPPSSSSGDSAPCPICLSPFLQESYLDTCFHKFCYSCILHWSKVVAVKRSASPPSVKCPLCKTENFSIIYGFDGSSFKRHYMTEDLEHSSFFTEEHKYRLQCYYMQSGTLMSNVVNVSQYWKSGKYRQPNRWLKSWLRREIQALLQEEDVEIIVHHILGVVDSFQKRNEQTRLQSMPETKQGEFKTVVSEAAKLFLAARTDRFANELELFLASGFNIEAYDEVYKQQLGWNARAANKDAETSDQAPAIRPYLYILDADSDDETD